MASLLTLMGTNLLRADIAAWPVCPKYSLFFEGKQSRIFLAQTQ
jgi:hypothetical protein